MKLNQQFIEGEIPAMLELLEKISGRHTAIKIRSEKIIQTAANARKRLANVRFDVMEFERSYEELMVLLVELKEEEEMK